MTIPFDLDRYFEILERTPAVLEAFLTGLSPEWIAGTEGFGTWSPYDVIGHLIHGERTDWVARLDIILRDGPDDTFVPFDRYAQFRESAGKSLADLLSEFAEARRVSLARVRALHLTDADLNRTGIHPQFGSVTARQLLSTWAAHDLDHLMQISRVLAAQIGDNVGPWREYLKILRSS